MNQTDIISIICGILSVLAAIISVIVTITIANNQRHFEVAINTRDEERHKIHVQSEALRFIQKYNSNDEIQLIGLCVIADKYDSTFPYRRKIYKDFCCLNNEVKKELINKLNIDCQLLSLKEENFYENSLFKIKSYLEKQFPKQPNIYSRHFYESAKYFYRALSNHRKEIVPDYILCKRKTDFGNLNYKYSSLITDVLSKQSFEITLENGKLNPAEVTVDELFEIPTEDGTATGGKEIVMCYLICMISKYVSIYAGNKEIEDCGFFSDYFSFHDKYMEDLFLDALLAINYENKIYEQD